MITSIWPYSNRWYDEQHRRFVSISLGRDVWNHVNLEMVYEDDKLGDMPQNITIPKEFVVDVIIAMLDQVHQMNETKEGF